MELHEQARAKLVRLEEERGRLYAALIRGEACCQVNDPDYSREWWQAALAELEYLSAPRR